MILWGCGATGSSMKVLPGYALPPVSAAAQAARSHRPDDDGCTQAEGGTTGKPPSGTTVTEGPAGDHFSRPRRRPRRRWLFSLPSRRRKGAVGFADVRGQESAKRAVVIVAAGSHNTPTMGLYHEPASLVPWTHATLLPKVVLTACATSPASPAHELLFVPRGK
jgi:hypothetical protein